MQSDNQRHQRMAKHAACSGLSHGGCGRTADQTHQQSGWEMKWRDSSSTNETVGNMS